MRDVACEVQLVRAVLQEELIDGPQRARDACKDDDPLSNDDQSWKSAFKVCCVLRAEGCGVCGVLRVVRAGHRVVG